MFNVGIGEVMVLALVALLVFGPNRLPEIMRTVGKAVRTFQSESQRATAMLKEGLEETKASLGVVDTPDPVAAGIAPDPAPAPAVPEAPPQPSLAPTVAGDGDGHTHSHDVPETVLESAAREYEDT